MKPAGYKKDVLVAMFCGSLLVVAEEKFDDDCIINVDTNMQISQKLLWLAKEIQTTLNNSDNETKLYIRSVTSGKSIKEVKKEIMLADKMDAIQRAHYEKIKQEAKPQGIMKKVLFALDGVVNLELLAMYILFVNFVERKQKLDKDLQYLAEFDYMEVAEYLCSTKISEVEEDMFKLAYEVLGILK